MKRKLKFAGPIFCEPLNGKLLEFPETMEELEYINDFQLKTTQKLNLTEISIERPFMNPFKGESTELVNIKTGKPIKPTKDVLNFISMNKDFYQEEEELCYIMSTTIKGSKSNSILANEICDKYTNLWTVCEFKQPVLQS